jgi:hypothetical protein
MPRRTHPTTGDRVKVTLGAFTALGTIGRVLINGPGCWVRLDVDPPTALAVFEKADPRYRSIRVDFADLELL